jgi:hypothetical protein
MIAYPKVELVDCATRIFFQAESTRRMRTALRLLNVALKSVGEI